MNVRHFGQQRLQDPQLEGLLTDGLGGFSLTSLAGVPTRCYSGLAVSLEPPARRWLMWLSPLEHLNVAGHTAELHAFALAPGAYDGSGLRLTSHVTLRDLLPERVQVFAGARVTRRMVMPRHSGALVYLYDVQCAQACTLTLGGLFTDRDMHAVHVAAPNLSFEVRGERAVVRGQQTLTLRVQAPAGQLQPLTPEARPQRVYLPMEPARGGPDNDRVQRADLWRVSLPPGGGQVALVVDGLGDASLDAFGAWDAEGARRAALVQRAWDTSGVRDDTVATLAVAADAFVVRRESTRGVSVIAGYPWFADWGRDSMIALDGLLLQTGRFEEARSLLQTFLSHMQGGLTPNNFLEDGQGAGFNTVDGALWLAQACQRYVRATDDLPFAREALARLREALAWHVRGTLYGIRLDAEGGLLLAGEAGVQLTWMDVKIADWVVTPRHGAAVEIQALWVGALEAESWLSARLNERPQFEEVLQRSRAAFGRFWNAGLGFCWDVLSPDGAHDPSVRPNALIALSLPGTPATPPQVRAALQLAARELVTPQGTHTLAPSDPRYLGNYGGPQLVRDAAYHQGTIWPWPMGAYVDLLLREGRVVEADAALDGLRAHLWEAGVGSVSEVFAGDARTPGGCPFQAWSVAEVLRAHIQVRRAAGAGLPTQKEP